MPEGSRDVVVGVTVVQGERTTVLPFVSAMWSNGAFLSLTGSEGLELGVHLSENPEYEYGPLLNVRTVDQSVSGGRAVQGELGGFWSWNFDHSLDFFGRALTTREGKVAVLGAAWHQHLASHHDIEVRAGLVGADARLMQAQFGRAAGIANRFVGVEWIWQLGNKYHLISGIQQSNLADSAVRGTAYATLRYRY